LRGNFAGGNYSRFAVSGEKTGKPGNNNPWVAFVWNLDYLKGTRNKKEDQIMNIGILAVGFVGLVSILAAFLIDWDKWEGKK
jgi:hypothetical protein